MGVFSTIKRWIDMLLRRDLEQEFNITEITSQEMNALISRCGLIYQGRPPWINKEGGIKTINFAKVICSETARLTTLAIGIQFNENSRGKWLQEQFDRKTYFKLRHWTEYGNAYGTIVLKPSTDGIDMFLPGQFAVTSTNGKGEIDGIVFRDTYQESDEYYTRLEYHRYEGDQYVITNKAFKNNTAADKGKPIALVNTKWANLMPEAVIENVAAPLFGVYRTPEANNVDLDSPLGMPQFKEAEEELKDLDIAYSRNAEEIFDSERISLIEDTLLMKDGQNLKRPRLGIELPRFIKNVLGSAKEDFYQEINPELNTETRILGMNNQLDFIGYKSGYSPGYFRFDAARGAITATQVEADDRRTIQLIKDHRDKLEDCLDGLIYALNVFADLYDLAPSGEYEVFYDFGDITFSETEDKMAWWKYRLQGDVPPWLYYVKYEGMSEDEAKEMVEEAQVKTPTLFEEE